MVPAIDAAKLFLKVIRRLSDQENSEKADGAAKFCLMEKLQTLCTETEKDKTDIELL